EFLCQVQMRIRTRDDRSNPATLSFVLKLPEQDATAATRRVPVFLLSVFEDVVIVFLAYFQVRVHGPYMPVVRTLPSRISANFCIRLAVLPAAIGTYCRLFQIRYCIQAALRTYRCRLWLFVGTSAFIALIAYAAMFERVPSSSRCRSSAFAFACTHRLGHNILFVIRRARCPARTPARTAFVIARAWSRASFLCARCS